MSEFLERTQNARYDVATFPLSRLLTLVDILHCLTHEHTYTHAHTRTHMHTLTYTFTHMNTHAHTCTHMHTYAHTCTHMHTPHSRHTNTLPAAQERRGKFD